MNQLRIAGCTPGALRQAGKDIIDRSSKIMDAFLEFLKNNDLTK